MNRIVHRPDRALARRAAPRGLAVGALATAVLAAGLAAAPAGAAEDPPTALAPSAARGAARPVDPAAAPPAPRVLVKFRPGIRAASAAGALRRTGLPMPARTLGLTGARVLDVPAGASAAALAAALERDPAVAYATPDVWRRPTALPSDPKFPALWGLHNTGQKVPAPGSGWVSGQPDVDVDAPAAWRHTTGSGEVVVGVIDTGVDVHHPDLAGALVPGWDFHHDDATVYDPADGEEHGTHVAGTIAARRDNGVGVVGVAPRVRVMPLKVLGPTGGWDSDVIDALAFAKRHGVRVVNMSLGASRLDDPDAANPALKDAIRRSGMLVVAAAGNGDADGRGLDNDDPAVATYPASFDLPNIVSVAAVDHRGRRAPFSNYGATSVDLAAPGVGVLSTVPKTPPAVTASASRVRDHRVSTVFWGFGLEDVTAAHRVSLVRQALGRFKARPGTPILLVRDDERDLDGRCPGFGRFRDAGAVWHKVLTKAGYTDVEQVTVRSGATGPGLARMSSRIVVWVTGDGYGGYRDSAGRCRLGRTPLTPVDLQTLAAFTYRHGRLLLAGSDALIGNEDAGFVQNRLRLRWLAEEGSRRKVVGTGALAGRAWALDPWASVYRDVVAPLRGARALAVYPGAPDHRAAYARSSGTSMAAPHVTGAAALVLSLRPGSTPTSVKQTLLDTATPLSALQGRTVTGGIVRAGAAVSR